MDKLGLRKLEGRALSWPHFALLIGRHEAKHNRATAARRCILNRDVNHGKS